MNALAIGLVVDVPKLHAFIDVRSFKQERMLR